MTAGEGRTLVVTGGSRGIGAAVVRLAAQAGYRVLFSYRADQAAAEALVAGIGGDRVTALRSDVAREEDVLALFAEADRRFGRLDALVNNAGIVDAKARVDEIGLTRLTRMMAVNVIGPFLCAREAVKRMSTRHGGRGGAIVNVSSMASTLGGAGDYVDYAASKGAIDTLTVGLAREVAAEGVRVNAVRPGIIDTDIHASGGQPDRAGRMAPLVPMQRAGSAEEVARAVLFLLSDEASYTTGALLPVGGGR